MSKSGLPIMNFDSQETVEIYHILTWGPKGFNIQSRRRTRIGKGKRETSFLKLVMPRSEDLPNSFAGPLA